MIKSLLDNDLYKFTMMQAVMHLYPDVNVTYNFINRRPSNKFSRLALLEIESQIKKCGDLTCTDEQLIKLQKKCNFIKPSFIHTLKNFRLNPNHVQADIVGDQLQLSINGKWYETILWEVPLMAIISETYFYYMDQKWDYNEQEAKLKTKGEILKNCIFADFGTRRRRNFKTQRLVVKTLRQHPGFIGTSNVHLALENDCKPIGTMAHEWIMAHQQISSIKHCNKDALMAWNHFYEGNLGIALTDTVGTKMFFKDFNPVLSRLFDGIRHDSGDPIVFIDMAIAHYQSHQINPKSKIIVFSDGLTAIDAAKLQQICEQKGIRCSFGIGTHFTNDFTNSPALNIVIKMSHLNNKPIVKLSDVSTKAIGDKDALRVTNWIVNDTPLDNPL